MKTKGSQKEKTKSEVELPDPMELTIYVYWNGNAEVEELAERYCQFIQSSQMVKTGCPVSCIKINIRLEASNAALKYSSDVEPIQVVFVRNDKKVASLERQYLSYETLDHKIREFCRSLTFEEVLSKELEIIGQSRKIRHSPTKTTPAENLEEIGDSAYNSNLVGLALSGGGIRSATFNFGILQAFADNRYRRLLQFVDYLSTVSGGGYIGSWLHAYIYRTTIPFSLERNELSGILKVQENIATGGDESKPEDFLREYSNYLTPQLGFFSRDSWSFIATYLRNLVLNQSLLISMLAALLMTVFLFFWIGIFLKNKLTDFGLRSAILSGDILIAAVFVLATSALQYNRIPSDIAEDDSKEKKKLWVFKPWNVAILILVMSSILGTIALQDFSDENLPVGRVSFGMAILYGIAWLIGGTIAYKNYVKNRPQDTEQEQNRKIFQLSVLWSPFAGLVGGLCILGIYRLFVWVHAHPFHPNAGLWLTTLIGPPLLLTAFGIAGSFHLGFMGHKFPDYLREWWSRMGGLIQISSFLWIVTIGIAVFGPLIFSYIAGWLEGWLATPAVLGWIGTTVWGIVIAKSEAGDNTKVKRIVLKLAPYVFITGLLIIISTILFYFLSHWNPLNHATRKDYFNVFYRSLTFKIVLLCLTLSILSLFLSWRIDINEFSMHHLYRNRLTRCYLGASVASRAANSFTGLDPKDDIELAKLVDPLTQGAKDANAKAQIHGPFPIINTTLNLVHGRRLAWQERKAASFCITPLYSGYSLSYRKEPDSYALTKEASDEDLTLGTAMAISGAAASPNMGYHSSPAVAFLMTVFNVRLGWWIGNPEFRENWKMRGPKFTILYLLNELLGRTDESSNFVYLSDGGHFENLGIYELVKRQCKYIIACDASMDQCYEYGDLGDAIRKCRIDLGVSINIDTRKIGKAPGMYYTIGQIVYDESRTGYLLYIKPCLTESENEPIDIVNFQKVHKDFPHKSTANQWFSESEFESYRILGFSIAERIIDDAFKNKTEDLNQVENPLIYLVDCLASKSRAEFDDSYSW